MFLFFTGFVISIASITSYKQNPKILCRIPEKVKLSVKDIVNLDIFEPDKYELRQPNLLLNTEFITDKTKINDYFYEIIDIDNNDNINKTYRITFDFI